MPEIPLKISEFLKPAAEMASSVKEMAKGTPLEPLMAMADMAYAPIRDTLKAQGLEVPESAPLPGEAEYYIAKNLEEGKVPTPTGLPMPSSSKSESLGEVGKIETEKPAYKPKPRFEIKEA